MSISDRTDLAGQQLRPYFRAAKRWPYNGQQTVLARHTLDVDAIVEPGRPTRVILTLDEGTHASGWWRNSDYDRCWHLSISHPRLENAPRLARIGTPEGLLEVQKAHPLRGKTIVGYDLDEPSADEVRCWARAAFPEHYGWTWTEPPASRLDPYRMPGVTHVRLFLDKAFRPILPEGEVYTLKPWDDGTSPEKVFR